MSELLVIFFIVMVLFGAKRLPGLGESLGRGIKNFKDSMSGKKEIAAKEEDNG